MLSETPILSERLPGLRFAIRASRVSFPAQVPMFARQYRSDVQWRIAALYFVQGWSFEQLALRYGLTRRRIRQIIRGWAESAIQSGYLQQIPPEPQTVNAARQEHARPVAVHMPPERVLHAAAAH
jgi:hypothetical protein